MAIKKRGSNEMKKTVYKVARYEPYDNSWFVIGGENETFDTRKEAEELVDYHSRDGSRYKVVEEVK